MTREEAIRILDPETSRDALWKYEGDGERLEMVNEACRIAVAALQAQQDVKPLEIDQFKLDRSRWEGCDLCLDYRTQKPIEDIRGDIVLSFGAYKNYLSYGKIYGYRTKKVLGKFKFCPFCGRPLTEEAWAEEKERVKHGTEKNKKS